MKATAPALFGSGRDVEGGGGRRQFGGIAAGMNALQYLADDVLSGGVDNR